MTDNNDKNNKTKKFYKDRGFAVTIAVLSVLAVVLVCGAFIVRNSLIENTKEYGQMLVKNYAAEEEVNIRNLKKNLELAAYNLEEIKQEGFSQGELSEWFTSHRKKVSYLMENRITNFYGIVDGKAITAENINEVSLNSFKSRVWYKMANEAEGKIVFTGIYRDHLTGKDVTTVAKKITTTGDVIAMDLRVDRKVFSNNISKYLKEANFFIYDNEDKLVYYKTCWETDSQKIIQYADETIAFINRHSGNVRKAYINQTSVEEGIYSTKMSNGGTVVMVVPLSHLLNDKKNMIMYTFLFLAVGLFVIVATLFIRNITERRKYSSATRTIGLLGDMYYSIYKFNMEEGYYEVIKMPKELMGKIEWKGDLTILTDLAREFVEKETLLELKRRFNMGKVTHKQAKVDYSYYGGEFKRRFGDQYKWVSVRIIQDGSLANGESIWCFREVEEEKNKELQNTMMLKAALDASRKMTSNKSKFFSQMSHDMRTPLNAIIGFAKLSNSSGVDVEKLHDYMSKIEISAEQLLSLINDILEYSSIEEENANLNIDKFNLEETLTNVITTFNETVNTAGKYLSYELDIKNPVVMGDGFKVVQILNNLISNSIKYSNSGDSIKVRVTEFGTDQHGKYQFVVEDTGIGMSKDFLKRVFEPYARETQFLSNQETMGTGLGMLIVRNLVTMMNGEISMKSKLGMGTTVTVTLPFEIVQEEETGAVTEQGNGVVSKDEKGVVNKEDFFNGKKILAAEDNQLNMEILTELLKMRGVEVTQAWNGKEAVERFDASKPNYFDCILMDMHMPIMDGCQATQSIRKLHRPDAGTVPILAVTANAFAEDIEKTTAAGMNGHVSKPLDFDVLYDVMDKLMR